VKELIVYECNGCGELHTSKENVRKCFSCGKDICDECGFFYDDDYCCECGSKLDDSNYDN
jgi:hypothetical protein